MNRRCVIEGMLWDVMVIYFQIVAQFRLELGGERQASLVDDFAYAVVEVFNDAVGLWMQSTGLKHSKLFLKLT